MSLICKNETLQNKVDDILAHKDWSEEAKKYIRDAILFTWVNYIELPSRIDRQTYITSYLEAVEKTNSVHIFDISDFNQDVDGISCFKAAIREVEHGDFDIIDGKYIPSKSGNFCCTLGAYTDTIKKNIYFLAESDPIFRAISVQHELTHIQEGDGSFRLPETIPFAKEFRTMCYEGRASMHESFLHQTFSDCCWCDVVKNKTEKYKFYSNQSPYSLYNLLYSYLIITFGYDTMEELAKNDDFDTDMLSVLKSKFPSIPIDELYAHLVYILCCFHGFNYTVIKNIINLYKVDCYRDITYIKVLYSEKKKELDETQKAIATAKSKEERDNLKRRFYKNYIALTSLHEKINQMSSTDFTEKLSSICLKEPSLDASFSYVVNLAYETVKRRYSKNGSNPKEYDIFEASLKRLSLLSDIIYSAKYASQELL